MTVTDDGHACRPNPMTSAVDWADSPRLCLGSVGVRGFMVSRPSWSPAMDTTYFYRRLCWKVFMIMAGHHDTPFTPLAGLKVYSHQLFSDMVNLVAGAAPV